MQGETAPQEESSDAKLPPASDMTLEAPRRLYVGVLAGALAALSVVALYVAISSRLLRPGADDYCLAADADRGIIGGVVHWWQELSGNAFSMLGNMALVGWPVLHMPWRMASAVTFLIGAVLIALCGITILALTRRWHGWRSSAVLLLAVPAFMVGWWAYLWVPVTAGQDGINRWLAYGLTHWQTLTGGYVFPTTVLLASGLIAWRLIAVRRRLGIPLLTVVGLLAGFSGVAMALTVVMVAALVLPYALLAGTLRASGQRLAVMLFGLAAAFGGILSHNSPGSRARMEQLGSDTALSGRRLAESLNWTFPEAVNEWFNSYANYGALTVFLLAVGLSWLAIRAGLVISGHRARDLSLGLSALALVGCITSRATEVFAYEGYWHYVMSRIFVYFAIVCAGVAVAAVLARRQYRLGPPLVTGVVATLVLIAGGAALAMTLTMAERYAAWELGPAPIPGIVSDIVAMDGMEMRCWNNLIQLRDAPLRGLGQ